MKTQLSRRNFLKVGALGGAGLLISFYLPGCGKQTPPPTSAPTITLEPTLSPGITPTTKTTEEASFEPNVYITITPDNQVTIVVARSEMGQGVQTSLPMIVAEELGADWKNVRLVQAPPNPKYGNQVTGGSVSVQSSYDILRLAGAMGRELLIMAAAQIWGLPKEELAAEESAVHHQASGKSLSFGELASTAAALKPPAVAPLKKPQDFRLIGARQGQVANPEYITGKASYGSDVALPGMLYAVIARCPEIGGKVKSFDATQAEAVPGVRKVVQIPNGIAVAADNTWAAILGRQALQIEWESGANAELSADSIHQAFETKAQEKAPKDPENTAVAKTIEAIYELPYLAHTTMEPMNCTADVQAERCLVYGPTQDRQAASMEAQQASGKFKVEFIVPLIGCGSGRRLEVDYVPEAVQVSKAIGAPVKVVWTRDDDIQHDYFRPASYHRLRAGLDNQGYPVTWTHDIFSQGIHGAQPITQGAADLPYKLVKAVRAHLTPFALPTTYWRSVYNNQNAFANECFLDEIAAEMGKDPLELRLELLGKHPLAVVLQLAAEKAGWGKALPEGREQGIACHSTWGVTHVAQVAEVSVSEGNFHVHRVVCAVDCGTVINPDMVEAQMEGGIVFGLSALRGQITFSKGRVQQSNFHDFPLLRINEMPTVEVFILPSDSAPKGIGEMGNPPIGPAVVNALYALTGKRIRRLPIQSEDL